MSLDSWESFIIRENPSVWLRFSHKIFALTKPYLTTGLVGSGKGY